MINDYNLLSKIERNDRGTGKGRSCETGGLPKRSNDWLDALKNSTFKKTLIRYLIEAWN